MQAVFLDNWMRVTGKVLHGGAYFPDPRPAGPMAAQMFSSSPSGGNPVFHPYSFLTTSVSMVNTYGGSTVDCAIVCLAVHQ